MKLKGKAHKYGANVDTDAIIPARYLNISEASNLAQHCMEDIDEAFLERMNKGDIIVAGTNFGCGSSREHAPLAIKASGVSCVIAESFARIFLRNAINIGLPVLECGEMIKDVETGDLVEVDLSSGELLNVTRGKKYNAQPYPEFLLGIISNGGLVKWTKRKMAERSKKI